MASLFATCKFALLATLFLAVFVSGLQFDVGEHKEWAKPTGNEPMTYNEWASQNRFHVGDTVRFKYQNDSVLVVTGAAYSKCDTSIPIIKFDDGNTVFKFGRPGFFYFISGVSDHCKSGQKVTIRVMHPKEVEGPVSAPTPAPVSAPTPGGGSEEDNTGSNLSPPKASSSTKLFVVSYLVTVAASLFVFLYIVM